MLVKFKQAVHLNGKDYANGSVHEVTEELNAHPYFHKLIGAGLVIETEAAKVISAETLEERQKKLADTLLKQNKVAQESRALAAKKAADAEAESKGEKSEESGEKSQDQALAEESAKAESEAKAVESEEAEEAEVEHKDHPAHKNKKSKR